LTVPGVCNNHRRKDGLRRRLARGVEGFKRWEKATKYNNKEANKYVKPVFGKGWELKPLT
jgi:hypothetical protein